MATISRKTRTPPRRNLCCTIWEYRICTPGHLSAKRNWSRLRCNERDVFFPGTSARIGQLDACESSFKSQEVKRCSDLQASRSLRC